MRYVYQIWLIWGGGDSQYHPVHMMYGRDEMVNVVVIVSPGMPW
ncbi:hypothetical protein AB24_4859 [Escherichia coli 6-537-08_S1_C1]|nr:hypothetical protein AB24_4859 [Escherichia coli 6-537-08_S1_C1]